MQDRIYKTEAVVLRRYDFGEAGKQLVIYTPRLGKRSVLAKGVKRTTSRLAGHLEPLALASIVAARGRNLDTVTQASTVESFSRLRNDGDRVFHGLMVAELLDKLTPEQEENHALWTVFTETLRRLDTEQDPWAPSTYFQVRAIALSGYRPELEACVQCEGRLDARAVYYSPRLGGALCPEHRLADAGSFEVSANAIKVLRAAVGPSYESFRRLRVSDSLRAEVDRILRLNLRTLLEVEVSSAALIDHLSRQPVR